MIETLHIFDEFSHSPELLSKEQRHAKRMALDPLLYDILKSKYGKSLEDFWKKHTFPQETDSYLVIVERRLHPNLAFTLYNMAYFARGWGMIVICSDLNYEYCKAIAGTQCESILILPLLQGNPTPLEGKNEYNRLLKDASFYESLPGEHHLFFQVDSYLRKPVPEEWKRFHYVAAPYEWDETSSGGGLSYRRKSAMIDICKTYQNAESDEDAFICQGIKDRGYSMPPFELAVTYISESCIYEDPIGVHQWWTFFFPQEMEDAEELFHRLLSMEME